MWCNDLTSCTCGCVYSCTQMQSWAECLFCVPNQCHTLRSSYEQHIGIHAAMWKNSCCETILLHVVKYRNQMLKNQTLTNFPHIVISSKSFWRKKFRCEYSQPLGRCWHVCEQPFSALSKRLHGMKTVICTVVFQEFCTWSLDVQVGECVVIWNSLGNNWKISVCWSLQ